eukprot:GHVO01069377.1.p1 GENE.GHVO01069377.1~~GHVO01069377.1.p1  ORF type:complete len:241 (+),score=38.71 GHVO01069377.1:59-781(+)
MIELENIRPHLTESKDRSKFCAADGTVLSSSFEKAKKKLSRKQFEATPGWAEFTKAFSKSFKYRYGVVSGKPEASFMLKGKKECVITLSDKGGVIVQSGQKVMNGQMEALESIVDLFGTNKAVHIVRCAGDSDEVNVKTRSSVLYKALRSGEWKVLRLDKVKGSLLEDTNTTMVNAQFPKVKAKPKELIKILEHYGKLKVEKDGIHIRECGKDVVVGVKKLVKSLKSLKSQRTGEECLLI